MHTIGIICMIVIWPLDAIEIVHYCSINDTWVYHSSTIELDGNSESYDWVILICTNIQCDNLGCDQFGIIHIENMDVIQTTKKLWSLLPFRFTNRFNKRSSTKYF